MTLSVCIEQKYCALKVIHINTKFIDNYLMNRVCCLHIFKGFQHSTLSTLEKKLRNVKTTIQTKLSLLKPPKFLRCFFWSTTPAFQRLSHLNTS